MDFHAAILPQTSRRQAPDPRPGGQSALTAGTADGIIAGERLLPSLHQTMIQIAVVDDNQDLAMKYGVMSIPTLIVFKNGEEIDRSVGALPKARLQALLEKHL